MTLYLGRITIGIGRPWDWKPYRMATASGGFSFQWLYFSLNYDRPVRAQVPRC